jgi:8-oxo-dGTP pyrophosphatase MutT (NUDIX family)
MEKVYEGDYVKVVNPKEYNYEYIDEPDLIITIPYLVNKGKFGIRKELIPPYKEKDKYDKHYTLLCGQIEEKETKQEATLRELQEEAGLKEVDYEIISKKDHMPLCKLTNVRVYFTILKIYDYVKEDPRGDGSYFEEQSETQWVTKHEWKQLLNKSNIDFKFFMGYHSIKDISIQEAFKNNITNFIED